MKIISVIIPVLNEEDNIVIIYEKIKSFFHNKQNYKFEIIFTDNNSKDKTAPILQEICSNDASVKCIRFKYNIGYDRSVLQGYMHSTGDAAVALDCDLQDPTELIDKFLNYWEEGYDLIYGVRKKREEGKLFTLLRNVYYKLMNKFSFFRYPIGAGDFRLIDNSIIKKLKNQKEFFPYVRGLTYLLSNNAIGVEYDRLKRVKGKSKFNYLNAFKYALNAIIEESFLIQKILTTSIMAICIFYIFLTFIDLFFGVFNLKIYLIIIIALMLINLSFNILNNELISRSYLKLKNREENIFEKKINFV